MARFLISRLAREDLSSVLAISAERWGNEGRHRYAALIAAAIRKVAAEPEGPLVRSRDELHRGVRSFHLRHARAANPTERVMAPVHVLYFRIVQRDLIEIVRVLHERMEPSRHLDADDH
jgi:toxin ParE1/3/4